MKVFVKKGISPFGNVITTVSQNEASLFNLFKRQSESNLRNKSGFGVGLFIAHDCEAIMAIFTSMNRPITCLAWSCLSNLLLH
jgi:hypothetical protein